MRIGRSVIIPVILALSTAGSIVAGSVVPAVATATPAAHVVVTASSATPDTHFWG